MSKSKLTTLELVKLAKEGNQQAFSLLLDMHWNEVLFYHLKRNLNENDAEDIVIQTFSKAFDKIETFDEQYVFKTWLIAISKNVYIDFLRKKKIIPFSSFDNEDGNALTDTLADPAPLPDALLERQDLANLLTRALTKISFKYRAVLLLRYNNHFTFREIAESLGEPLNTIKSRHRRALIILKKILGKSSF